MERMTGLEVGRRAASAPRKGVPIVKRRWMRRARSPADGSEALAATSPPMELATTSTSTLHTGSPLGHAASTAPITRCRASAMDSTPFTFTRTRRGFSQTAQSRSAMELEAIPGSMCPPITTTGRSNGLGSRAISERAASASFVSSGKDGLGGAEQPAAERSTPAASVRKDAVRPGSQPVIFMGGGSLGGSVPARGPAFVRLDRCNGGALPPHWRDTRRERASFQGVD